MKVLEIRNEAEWDRLGPGWNELVDSSVSNTIFLTSEWLRPWWSAYGGLGGGLCILAAYDDAGVLRGVAPLRRKTARRFRQTVPAIAFVGDGSNDSDYLDFIATAGWEAPVFEAFHSRLEEELRQGAVLLLNEIPETSPNLTLARQLGELNNRILVEKETPCGTVRLPETWEGYLEILKPRFRTKVRSVLRNLEAKRELRFGFCQTPEEVERLLPILYDLHERRWAEVGKPGVFVQRGKRDFYRKLSSRLLERGWLRFSWLEWNGTVLACQYGFVYQGVYSQLQEGYEPNSEHWNAGIGLRAWSIREFIRQGVREYDFLGGIGRHKSDWGAEVKHSRQLVLANRTYKNVLFCRGPEWEARARESVRKALPAKILALRQAHSNGQNGNAFSAKQWMRETAAKCYFHLPLPKLVQPLRSQYRLALPKFSLKRRREASARILYYHRVNNDGDPFFPAISTALFEQEMRYLAKHYKVVSLSDLLTRLVDGPPERTLAITFDDGYLDNYENAFPVLEKYGLPATIFLTTGSIDDSHQVLWFERLAGAVKRTSSEYLDLEIDLPRRFWMRTTTERLEANNGIFAVLRRLPDRERRTWLDVILRQLGAPEADPDRHGKMLTWDQVRFMKSRGIDFGGHTVTHPFISQLTPKEVAWEVGECKRRIENELQLPVASFAYPNGREEDFGKWNKSAIREAGYRAAVTTIWGLNYASTDPMELRRGGPWEESPALFAYKMDWYELTEG
jgi:peptidoglycan/xylan/chitin deacetylase (PgdA/CDA1 family)/CelD/BcsL family acetyltransferase involved in cellulose biosynthesis